MYCQLSACLRLFLFPVLAGLALATFLQADEAEKTRIPAKEEQDRAGGRNDRTTPGGRGRVQEYC